MLSKKEISPDNLIVGELYRISCISSADKLNAFSMQPKKPKNISIEIILEGREQVLLYLGKESYVGFFNRNAFRYYFLYNNIKIHFLCSDFTNKGPYKKRYFIEGPIEL